MIAVRPFALHPSSNPCTGIYASSAIAPATNAPAAPNGASIPAPLSPSSLSLSLSSSLLLLLLLPLLGEVFWGAAAALKVVVSWETSVGRVAVTVTDEGMALVAEAR